MSVCITTSGFQMLYVPPPGPPLNLTASNGSSSPNVIYFQEDYTGVPTGNVALDSSWTTKGYSDFNNSGTPSNLQILTRASMPAGLLADPNFPAGKTRACLFNLAASEIIATILWSGFPAGVTTASFSWWEYRATSQVGGEKFCRVGNLVPNDPNGARGIDSIWTLGQVSGLTLLANSLNMHQYPDQSFGAVVTGWPPGLSHFEAVFQLSTGTNADGSADFYRNGTRIAHAAGLQFYNTTAQSTIPLQLWDTGGWSSTGAGTEGVVTYPIVRYLCALRVANQFQGVWAMNAV